MMQPRDECRTQGSLLEGIDVPIEPAGRAPRPAQPLRRLALPLTALVLFGLAAAIAVKTGIAGGDLAAATQRRTVIDSETREVFIDFRVPQGASLPFRNPKTDSQTLYPAERCYWADRGGAKWEPTYVLVPPDADSAICPDCGRTVIPHNPRPPDDLMVEALERHRAGG